MKPRDAFGVVVRSVGLVAVFVATIYLLTGMLGLFSSGRGDAALYIIYSLALGFLGRYLIKGAPEIINIAYPQDKD